MTDASLIASLEHARFEVVPMRGVEANLPALPRDAVVTVTASPTRGIEATVQLTEQLVGLGYRAVPHLSARLVEGPRHLEAVVGRLVDLGIDEVFVVAGDAAHPAGPYEGALELLEALAERGRPFPHVGITGYPEAHAFLADRTTIEAMDRKAPHATSIVSQICFDPATVRRWVRDVRARGVQLPIHLGIPGVVDRSRLVRVAMRVGLGDSVRFLTKQHDLASRLLVGYEPDELVFGLADLVADPAAGIAGWHLFTFNEVERTERWRQRVLATARGAVG